MATTFDYQNDPHNRKWFGTFYDTINDKIPGLSTQKEIDEHKSLMDYANNHLYWIRQLKNNGYNMIPESTHRTAELIADRIYADGGGRSNTDVVTTIEEEIHATDAVKARVYYENNLMSQIFDSVTSPLGKFRFDIRQYGIQLATNPVKFSRTFDNATYTQVKIGDQKDTGIGLYAGYSISKMQLMESEGDFFDYEFELAAETSRQLGRAMNEHIATGTTTILGIPRDDQGAGAALTGFLNNSSNQGFDISTTTTWLNWIKGFIAALADLKKCRGPGDIICIMSSGCHSQMMANYPTYGKGDWNEWDEFNKRFVGYDKPIKRVYISDKITGSTLTTSTQCVVLMKLGEQFIDRKIVLPLQTWSSINKTYSEDIKQIMVVADILRFRYRPDTTTNPFPVTIETGLTTTDLGYLEEQRVA
jgi:hypothetical protein